MNVAIIMQSHSCGTIYQPHIMPREPCVLLSHCTASLSLWGTGRLKQDEFPPARCFPHPQHMQKTQSCHRDPSSAQHCAPCSFFCSKACVNTSFNQLFQDRCASLASEQCNYFPSSPLSKSRGFIGLLMV